MPGLNFYIQTKRMALHMTWTKLRTVHCMGDKIDTFAVYCKLHSMCYPLKHGDAYMGQWIGHSWFRSWLVRCQYIAWINDSFLLIRHPATNVIEIMTKNKVFYFNEIHVKLIRKCRDFISIRHVINEWTQTTQCHLGICLIQRVLIMR